ncbi:MAG: hypothetical protein JHD28_00750, partial [Bacteroidia bacterium]|nr:hypothetical protein [Bacteroidia bacterium]
MGIYDGYIITNTNGSGNVYTSLASTFHNSNLGTFNTGNSLVLNGAQNKTFKCSGGNVTGSNFYYRIYRTSATAGAFSSAQTMSFASNDGGGCGGNQTWERTNAGINVLSGLTSGFYHLEIYTDAPGSPSTAYYNNGGSNYRASFTVLPIASAATGDWSSTSTWVGGAVPPAEAAVTISNAHTVTLNQAATVSLLTINSGGTFTASDNTARTLTITKSSSGSLTTLANSGTWVNGVGGSTITFTGAPSSGDAIHGVTGTIAFQNVVINKTGGSNNVGVNFGTTGTSLATGGKLTIGTGGFVSTNIPTNFYTVNGSTTLEFSQTGGTYNVNAAPADITWPSSNSPANINITTGTVNLNTTRTASGNLNITGGVLALGANLTINGNWTRASSATFTPSTNTVTLSGSSAQTIQITGGGTATMYGLIINNSTGVSLSNSVGNLTNLNVTNSLTLTSGALTTNGNTLTLSSGIAITRATGTISTVPTFGGTSSVTYTTGGVTTDNELNTSVTNLSCSNTSGTVTLKSGASLTATTASNVSGGTFLVPSTSTLIIGSGGFTNAGPLTINGTLQLNAGSYINSATGFTYGLTGSLIYNTGGSYGMSNEWPASSGPNSITIQNSGTNLTIGASRTISATGSMTVNAGCAFSVSSGTLTTNNNLTLKSDATGTASIGNSAGSFSGEMTVERYIPANGRRYRFLASPVVGGTSLEWRDGAGIVTSGKGIQITGGTGTVDASTTNAPSAFYYNESSTTNTGINGVGKWVAIDGSTSLTNGRGYRVFVRGDRTISLTTVNSDNNATTISVSGTHPTGTVTLPVTYTAGDGGLGWNLVGNPYPCSIDFTSGSGWTKTSIGTGVAVYRPSSNSYAYSITNGDATNNVNVTTNGGSNIIGSGQAFWVRATS